MPPIVTLTMNPTLDKSAVVHRVVANQKLRCQPPRREPGGGGINVSRAIRRLGGESMAVYPSGGPTGRVLEELLDQESLQHQPVPIAGWTRENLTVLEEAGDQQYRFNMPGPRLEEAEWKRCLDQLAAFDPPPAFIVASGSLPQGVPMDFYTRLTRELEGRIVVDTSGDTLRAAVREGVYLVKPNMRELGQLAGEKIQDEAHQEQVAKEIVAQGQAEAVVVSLGAAGALLVSRELTQRFRAPTVPIESKIGAGDSMVAGIVWGLAEEKSLGEAVRFGVAAGAAAVMTPGTELCRREDTERLYQQMRSE